uniref:(northern house mosquito) hypothetical protein n=1 Tax=Culex pipiens TaxID=7175 RepID=A0A8D8NZK6_CULPI
MLRCGTDICTAGFVQLSFAHAHHRSGKAHGKAAPNLPDLHDHPEGIGRGTPGGPVRDRVRRVQYGENRRRDETGHHVHFNLHPGSSGRGGSSSKNTKRAAGTAILHRCRLGVRSPSELWGSSTRLCVKVSGRMSSSYSWSVLPLCVTHTFVD